MKMFCILALFTASFAAAQEAEPADRPIFIWGYLRNIITTPAAAADNAWFAVVATPGEGKRLVILRRSALVWALTITGEHGGFGWPVIVQGRETAIRHDWRGRLRFSSAIRPVWMFGRPRPQQSPATTQPVWSQR